MTQNGLELMVGYFAEMADAVHQGSLSTDIYTRYTTISDLTTGTFWLYYHLDYENPVEFVLADELAQGAHEIWMADLFPPRPDPDPIPDAGVADSGIADADADPPDAGGPTSCDDGGGCSASGGTSSPDGLPLLAALFLMFVVRRRRR
ncbi:MAG: MYXO-CTERM sorting domain-containing protein [bacterium]